MQNVKVLICFSNMLKLKKAENFTDKGKDDERIC